MRLRRFKLQDCTVGDISHVVRLVTLATLETSGVTGSLYRSVKPLLKESGNAADFTQQTRVDLIPDVIYSK